MQVPASAERLTFEEVGRRYLDHLEHVMQRKRTTIQDYRIILDRHLGPFFGGDRGRQARPRPTSTAYIAAKRRDGSRSRRSRTS